MKTLLLVTAVAFIAFAAALLPSRKRDPRSVAKDMLDLLRRQVRGEVGVYDWDDVMGIQKADPFLDAMRIRSIAVAEKYALDQKECTEGAR